MWRRVRKRSYPTRLVQAIWRHRKLSSEDLHDWEPTLLPLSRVIDAILKHAVRESATAVRLRSEPVSRQDLQQQIEPGLVSLGTPGDPPPTRASNPQFNVIDTFGRYDEHEEPDAHSLSVAYRIGERWMVAQALPHWVEAHVREWFREMAGLSVIAPQSHQTGHLTISFNGQHRFDVSEHPEKPGEPIYLLQVIDNL